MGIRNEARIWTSIWHDRDFLALRGDTQRLFMLILSQQNLGFSGLIDVTPGRWAELSADGTRERVNRSLRELHDARFVIVDSTTDEALVRTFIRGDKIWKMPKMLRLALGEAIAARSQIIRDTLADELLTIRQELPEGTEVAETLIVEALGYLVPPEAPPQGAREPRRQAPRKGATEGGRQGAPDPPRQGGREGAPQGGA